MLHGGWWRIFDGVWDMIAYLLRYYVYKRASANTCGDLIRRLKPLLYMIGGLIRNVGREPLLSW